MPEPLCPATGWLVLHLFLRLGPSAGREAVVAAVKEAGAPDDVQVVTFCLVGHKADFGVMVLAADLWRLRAVQTAVVDAGAVVADSYLSLTEVSEYAKGMPDDMKQPRLYPRLPPEGLRAFCFYPMSKRRWVGANWYEQPYEERQRMMTGHGTTGRTFAGRVVQVVTGSTGLDAFEWGVTLFARTPEDVKEVVYTMRYDEGSARYAEFGPFYVGAVAPIDEVVSSIGPA
ncbi:MAG: chlorite dismutase family protein [Acidimicrobiales bacterium]